MADHQAVDPASLLTELTAEGMGIGPDGDELVIRMRGTGLPEHLRDRIVAGKTDLLRWFAGQSPAVDLVHAATAGQRGLWHLNTLAPDSFAYHVGFAMHIHSEVDTAALDAAVVALLRRHHALRSELFDIDGEVLVKVTTAPATLVRQISTDDVRGEVTAEFVRPFDLTRGPLLRAVLISRHATEHVLLLTAHHAMIDAWSLRLVLDELRTLYTGGSLGAVAVQPVEHVGGEIQHLGGGGGKAALDHWLATLEPLPEPLALPLDRPRPSVRAQTGASHLFEFGATRTERLRKTAVATGTTLFSLLFTAYQTLLHRYSGQQELLVGTPLAGREDPAFAGLVGYLADLVPIRADFTGAPRFSDCVARTADAVLDGIEYGAYPFPLLVEQLRLAPDLSRPALCQAVFALHDVRRFGDLAPLFGPGGSTVDFGGLTASAYPLAQQEGQFEVSLELLEGTDDILGSWTYDPALFDPETVAGQVTALLGLLDAVVENPEAPIAELALGGAPTTTLAAATEAREPELLHRGFQRWASRTPEAVALVSDDGTATYRELDEWSDRLAAELRAHGAGPGARVGLCVDPGIELVVGVLGILKAGAAYLPLDPAYPADRITHMVTDAEPSVLVSSSRADLPVDPGDLPLVHVDALDSVPAGSVPEAAGPDDLAYVMYTSGSTGHPKAVMVTHANVDQLFAYTERMFDFSADDVWLLGHSFAFDFSTWEIWGALRHGGRLVVPGADATRSADQLVAQVGRHGVTVLCQTPTMFRQVSHGLVELHRDTGRMPVRQVHFGGEALDYRTLREWFEHFGEDGPELVNLYGITETTVHVTARTVHGSDVDDGLGSLIGPALPQARMHILDAAMRPVPDGVVGELYVGGTGVSAGYWHRPELTAQRFVPDPFSGAGDRLYRSGDLARRLTNGEVEYVGRADRQIQLRGLRVELGEIERVLASHTAVATAVVQADGDAENQQLIAYVTAKPEHHVDVLEVTALARARLPRAMVPAAVLLLDSLPMTPTGKLDRASLSQIQTKARPLRGDPTPPRTATESALLGIWQELLDADEIGVEDGFFDLGGHSLLATRLMARVRDRFGVRLPTELVFTDCTVAAQARFLEAVGSVAGPGKDTAADNDDIEEFEL